MVNYVITKKLTKLTLRRCVRADVFGMRYGRDSDAA